MFLGGEVPVCRGGRSFSLRCSEGQVQQKKHGDCDAFEGDDVPWIGTQIINQAGVIRLAGDEQIIPARPAIDQQRDDEKQVEEAHRFPNRTQCRLIRFHPGHVQASPDDAGMREKKMQEAEVREWIEQFGSKHGLNGAANPGEKRHFVKGIAFAVEHDDTEKQGDTAQLQR